MNLSLSVATPCLERSSGIEAARDDASEPGAFIAREPWTPIRAGMESELGIRYGVGTAYDTIAALTLPEDVVRLFGEAHRRDGLEVSGTGVTLTYLASSLINWLESETCWRVRRDGYREQGFLAARITARSATRESTTARFVGLHMDSWDRAPLEARKFCQNRLCLNLGPGARAFQFVALQADELRRRALQIPADPAHPLDRDLLSRFLRKNPDLPVLRFRLGPGQAYIAPTENLIHDACTLDDLPDLTYVYRGIIQPKDGTPATWRPTERTP